MRQFYALACAVLALLGCSKSGDSASQGRINVYMFSEYIDPELVKAFEKESGIKVRIDVYEATEEMMAKLAQAGGAGQYDVLIISDHLIPVLARQGLIQPLDAAKIPNAKNVAAKFRNPPHDPTNKYCFPYQWGTMGLLYRKDKIAQPEPTWGLLLDPARQPGPFVLIDSMRDMLSVALKYQGHSLNSRDAAEVRAAGELVLAAKKSEKALGFEGGVGAKNKLIAGDGVIGIVYNGDAVRAIDEDPKLDFVLPREGSLIWVDEMTIPTGAKDAEHAHAFINFILDAKNGAQLSNFNRYATPNEASLPLIKKEDRENPAIYPAEEMMKKLEQFEDLGADAKIYDEVWTTIKAR